MTNRREVATQKQIAIRVADIAERLMKRLLRTSLRLIRKVRRRQALDNCLFIILSASRIPMPSR
jgi:hypothetical protein